MKLIAIYGLSTETEIVIPMFSRYFYVVGLLDGFRKKVKCLGIQLYDGYFHCFGKGPCN